MILIPTLIKWPLKIWAQVVKYYKKKQGKKALLELGVAKEPGIGKKRWLGVEEGDGLDSTKLNESYMWRIKDLIILHVSSYSQVMELAMKPPSPITTTSSIQEIYNLSTST